MLGIDQKILNKIAASQPMKYKLTKSMFGLPPEVIDEREHNLLKFQAKEVKEKFPEISDQDAQYIANRIWEVLPLLLEREALINYAKENNDLTMYLTTIPVVDNVDQAMRLLVNEHPNLRSETKMLKIIKTYLRYLPKNLEKSNQQIKLQHPIQKRSKRYRMKKYIKEVMENKNTRN